ncbi:EAL domain-containing protein [Alsobacter sp. R-9]
MRRRNDAIVIGIAIVTVALAVAATVWAGLRVSWTTAALAGMAVLLVELAIAARWFRGPRPAAGSSRFPSPAPSFTAPPVPAPAPPDDGTMAARLESIENGLRTVARRCFELDQRMQELERSAAQRDHATLKAVSVELGVVGTLVRDLAEVVASHETELFGDGERRRPDPSAAGRREAPIVEPPTERIVPNAPVRKPARANVPVAEAADSIAPMDVLKDLPRELVPDAPEPAPEAPVAAPAPATPAPTPAAASRPAAPAEPAAASQAVRRALVSGAIDLFLHSIVSLPQRKVRIYEALGRVREPDGSFAESDTVAQAAARLGLTVKLETDLFRAVCKVASHLAARERDVPVMCPVSLTTLCEPGYFAVLSTAAEQDRQVAVRVVLRLRQAELARAGVLEGEAMEAVRALGFRFALDGVSDLRLDARDLAGRGIRYVKVPAPLMLAASEGDVPTEIHPADLADLLARQSVTLVASAVDSEAMVLEVQEFAVPLAQGPLFSGPRPVRGEVLTNDAPPPREPAAPSQPAAAAATAPEPAKPQRQPLRAFLRRTSA